MDIRLSSLSGIAQRCPTSAAGEAVSRGDLIRRETSSAVDPQQLKEQEQVTAEIQQTNNSLQRQVEQLQQQLSQQSNSTKHKAPSPVPLQAQVSTKTTPAAGSLNESVTVTHNHDIGRMERWREGTI